MGECQSIQSYFDCKTHQDCKDWEQRLKIQLAITQIHVGWYQSKNSH